MKDNIVKELEYANVKLQIVVDESPESPRNWDNLGTMVCFHRRYNLGDDHDFNIEDFENYAALEKHLVKNGDAAIVLPLYLYDHSGITMNTTGFSCRWDSGQVGFIYVSKHKVRERYGVKRITKKLLDKVKSVLIGEVETYDQYLRGYVYGFQLVDKENGNEIDSCYGFFGNDFKENGIFESLDVNSEIREGLLVQL